MFFVVSNVAMKSRMKPVIETDTNIQLLIFLFFVLYHLMPSGNF